MDPIFGFPSVVRFSWKTTTKILEDNQSKVEWFDPVPENESKYQFKKQENGVKKKEKPVVKHDYLYKVAQRLNLKKETDFEL